MSAPGFAHRPDIDGLRALAVLAVLAFHAQAAWLPGGFAGVDMFFVISGFVITGMLSADMDAGRFGLWRFYQRRARRLLPAYAAVSVVCTALAAWLLAPDDFLFFTTSLATSWAFCSNVFFSLLSWGYFGSRTDEFPLLHTWSLGVEEQFYFVFPLLLLLLRRRPRLVLGALALLTAAGLAWSMAGSGRVGSFFLLPYRAYQLLAGALTCMWVMRRGAPSRALAPWWAGAGLLVLVATVATLQRGLPYPGLRAVPPTLGMALLLYGGSRANPVSAALAIGPLRAVGTLSYTLYLWHWPLFAFLHYRHIALSAPVVTATLTASFVLAWLTSRYIEQPVRASTRAPGTALARWYLPPALASLALGLASYASAGLPQRFPAATRTLLASYSFERDLSGACALRSGEVRSVTLADLDRQCSFGAARPGAPALLLFGDSHANHFKPFVDVLARQAGLKGVYFVAGSCSADDLAPAGSAPTPCQQRNAAMLALAPRVRFVVLATLWKYPGGEAAFGRRMDRVIDAIVAAGAVPVVFKTAPWTTTDLSRCALFRARGWLPPATACTLGLAEVRAASGSMDAALEALARRHRTVRLIDPKPLTCDAARCVTELGALALYKDANHLNAPAARLLGTRYLARFGNPLGDWRPGQREPGH